ncbi:LysM peptidoglycan-binding domain-containing protein [Acinetobacter sp. SwsAc6]|jgi:LysM repeat protein|uniref:LysM peptidoglycan-binding domain-containing protein n=1 Tax=Acinetobacter TaxID=469 RepID=UPI000EA2BC2E|nr:MULTISPECIES: LysM domain-containing protein [Acinetobacter]NWK75528.1 LysM peptidoglycan-binding domain-containing protein [Acinetobacter sp. SwsAc6]RKG51744.1 LysM domain-containing protein [Acinetobacter cumulans]
MKFNVFFKDRQGHAVDGLNYKISVINDGNRKIKRLLVTSVTRDGKGKGDSIVGLEKLVFEVMGFPTPYKEWTEIGFFSYNKRMDSKEIRTITIEAPSIIINTKTFQKQEKAGSYERRTRILNKNLDKNIYLYPSIIKHTVKAGENLGSIAKQHSVSVNDISIRNKGININSLKVGQVIIIKDEIDAKKQELQDHKEYKKYIKDKFEISKNNSKVVVKIEGNMKGTQLMYVNFSGAIAAVIGAGASIQVGVARTPSGKWGIFVAPGVSAVQGTPSLSIEGGYLISEAASLDDLKGLGYSVNANSYFLLGGSAVVGAGLTPDALFDGKFDEGTTPMAGAETGIGGGFNIQHNLSYTFVIPLN